MENRIRETKEEIVAEMAKELRNRHTDLGDERAVLRDLQAAKFAYSLIILFSDEAVEKARTLAATGYSSPQSRGAIFR